VDLVTNQHQCHCNWPSRSHFGYPKGNQTWQLEVPYQWITEGSLEVKLPTIWTDEKQSRGEAERRGRLEERR